MDRLEAELQYLKKVNRHWYQVEIEKFKQVKMAQKYGGDPEAVAKMLNNLPPDYMPSEADEDKYLKREERRK